MIINANFGTQLRGSITPTDVCCSCVGGSFSIYKAEKISNIFKDNPGKLEALYSKLEYHPGQKKKPERTIDATGDSTMNSNF